MDYQFYVQLVYKYTKPWMKFYQFDRKFSNILASKYAQIIATPQLNFIFNINFFENKIVKKRLEKSNFLKCFNIVQYLYTEVYFVKVCLNLSQLIKLSWY